MTEQPSNLKQAALLTIFSAFSGLFLPLLGLFLFKAVENATFFDKAQFYYAVLATSGVAIIALGILDRKENISLFIFSFKESYLYQNGVTFFSKWSNVVHFSIILGLSLALFSVTTQTFFINLPSTEFQVTETGMLILATEPASTAETFFIGVFILSIIYTLLKRYLKKYQFYNKIILDLVTVISVGLIWVAIHYARYSTQETNLVATFFFGMLGAGMTVLTGSVLPWYSWHFFGNLFLKGTEMFSSQSVTIVISISLAIYIAVLFVLNFTKKK